MTTRGEPSRSRNRSARASISRVGPPPPSPWPNGTSEDEAAALVGEVARRVRQLRPGQLAVVGVDGREVREDPRAVDAFPVEGVMRELVRLVPRDLLREEPPRARQRDELRQGGGVPERVGQPDLLGLDAELVGEEPLAIGELPRQRLAAGHVRVGLDPHTADRNELAGLDAVGHPREDLGPDVAQPRKLLRGRHREEQVGMPVHEVGDVRRGAGNLADRLAHRPQPGRVDVRVADRAEPMRTRPSRGAEHLDKLGPRIASRSRHILQIEAVKCAVDGAQDLPPPRVTEIDLVGKLRRAPRGPAPGPTRAPRTLQARRAPGGTAVRRRRWHDHPVE